MVGLALPPVHALPGLLGFALLAILLAPEAGPGRGLVLGTLFGFGYFIVGIHWIVIAFFVDAERFGALAVPAVTGLSLALGLTVGLGTAVVATFRLRSIWARALLLGVMWTSAELLRGRLLLQFPWNPIASAWTAGVATMQPLAWLGTAGLGLVTVAVAASFRPTLSRAAPALALPLVLLAIGEARLRTVLPIDAPPVQLRLVQASIPQTLKWDPERRREWFERYLALSARPRDVPAQVLVWPESAVPYQIDREPVVRELIAELLPPGGVALVGGNHYDLEQVPEVAHNSVFTVGKSQEVLGRYDKVDLVPFGEFLPFRPLFAAVGLEKLTPGSLDFLPGAGRTVLVLPGLPAPSPMVCYEAIFPNLAAPSASRPGWLLNVTNDAWFGRSAGPWQHLAMARMRAVEEGLPLVRAANNGITAVTDAFGAIVASLPQDAVAVLDATLPPPLAQSSVARRAGWWLIAAAIVLTLASAAAVELARLRRAS